MLLTIGARVEASLILSNFLTSLEAKITLPGSTSTFDPKMLFRIIFDWPFGKIRIIDDESTSEVTPPADEI